MKTIGFVTSAQDPDMTSDDRAAAAELKKLGIETVPVIWDQTAPEGLDLLVLRSTWDYYGKASEFKSWLLRCRIQGVRLLNPPELALWNLNKEYLLELGGQGVAIPKTLYLKAGQLADLAETLRANHLNEAVIKPAVSMLGFDTWRTSLEAAPKHQSEFAKLLGQKDVLVQEFLPGILSEGEISAIFFDGQFSHAVRKIPKRGEFRIHEEHGGSRISHPLAPSEIASIRSILEKAQAKTGSPLLYARVDCVRDGNRWVLMEIELLDPALFMGYSPGAHERFARAIARRVSS